MKGPRDKHRDPPAPPPSKLTPTHQDGDVVLAPPPEGLPHQMLRQLLGDHAAPPPWTNGPRGPKSVPSVTLKYSIKGFLAGLLAGAH